MDFESFYCGFVGATTSLGRIKEKSETLKSSLNTHYENQLIWRKIYMQKLDWYNADYVYNTVRSYTVYVRHNPGSRPANLQPLPKFRVQGRQYTGTNRSASDTAVWVTGLRSVLKQQSPITTGQVPIHCECYIVYFNKRVSNLSRSVLGNLTRVFIIV